jgi:putative glutamine amidotransferase
MKPVIGLTTYGRDERKIQTLYYDEFFYLPAVYVDAVRRAGGVPLLLPPGGDDWPAWLSLLDGLIVTGGGDVAPAAYGGQLDHHAIAGVDLERDASEIGLVRQAAAGRSMPLLCICRGMQVLNVALGGTLYEHIPDVRDQDIHRATDGGWAIQEVQVKPDSLLAGVMGATSVSTHSGHHQAVKELGQGLVVSATAADGLPEALELPGHPWLVAVQWHPEMSANSEATQQRIFDRLVTAAAAGRRISGTP